MKQVNEFKALVGLLTLPYDLLTVVREIVDFDYIDVDYGYELNKIKLQFRLEKILIDEVVVDLDSLSNERTNILVYAIKKFNTERKRK